MAASERWYFTREQINSNPNRRMGMDADKELSLRQQAANFIQDMGQRLQVTQLCINTAIVYMHRFYMFHTFQRFSRNSISTCALFLAAKVEEQPRKLEHVIRCAQVCLKEKDVSQDTKSEAYNNMAHEVVTNENIMLQTLGFDIAIEHPHTYVVKCCQLVGASKDLAQTSYFMATNSLHLTTMCLQYKPTVVACVCIYLASKWSNWKIQQSKEGREWFYYIDKSVTMKELEEITSEFLTILEKSPSRLKRKLLMGSSKSNHHESSSSDKRPRSAEGSSSSSHSSGPSEAFSLGTGPPSEPQAPAKKPAPMGYGSSREKSSSGLGPGGPKPDHYSHHSMYASSRHSKPPPPSAAVPNDAKREVKPPPPSHTHPLKHKYPAPPSIKEEYTRKHMKNIHLPMVQDSNGQHNSESKRPSLPPHGGDRQAFYDMAKLSHSIHGQHHSSKSADAAAAKNHYVNNTTKPSTKFPPPAHPKSLEEVKPHNPQPPLQQRYLPENHVKVKVEPELLLPAEPPPQQQVHFPPPPVPNPSPPPNSLPPALPHLLKEEHDAYNVISPLKEFPLPPPVVPEEIHSLSNSLAPASPLLEVGRNSVDKYSTPTAAEGSGGSSGGGSSNSSSSRKEKHKHKYAAAATYNSGGTPSSNNPSIKMVLPIPKEKSSKSQEARHDSPKEGLLKLKIPRNKIPPPPEQSNSVTSTEPLKIVIHRHRIKNPNSGKGESSSRKRERSPSGSGEYHHSSKRPEGEKPPKHSKTEKNSESRKSYHHNSGDHHHRSSSNQYSDYSRQQSYPRPSAVPPLPKDPPPSMPPPPSLE